MNQETATGCSERRVLESMLELESRDSCKLTYLFFCRMVVTRNDTGSSTSNTLMTPDEIRDFVVGEIGRILGDTLPEMFAGIREEIRAMMEERFAAMPHGGGGQHQAPRPFLFKDFQAYSPPQFKGETDPVISQR